MNRTYIYMYCTYYIYVYFINRKRVKTSPISFNYALFAQLLPRSSLKQKLEWDVWVQSGVFNFSICGARDIFPFSYGTQVSANNIDGHLTAFSFHFYIFLKGYHEFLCMCKKGMKQTPNWAKDVSTIHILTQTLYAYERTTRAQECQLISANVCESAYI